MNYFGRHWRGELSLPVAFWVNNLLLMFPLGFAVVLLMVWIAVWGQSLQAASIGALLGMVVLAVVSVWAPVGAWRSATTYAEQGGSGLWAGLTKLVVGVGLVANVASYTVDVLPQLPEHLRLAAGRDPIGSLDIRLAADGRSVTLSGPFSMGASKRFEKVIQDAPQLKRVVLESPGGRLFEAHEIAGQVRARGLKTRAAGDCASACTLVFIAGQQRSLAPQARLGFHRASVPSHNPLHDAMANSRLQDLYEEAGLPGGFIARVLDTPSRSMWFPKRQELTAAAILPAPTLLPELDPDLLPPDAPVARFHDALADNPLWAELDRRQQGLLDSTAQRLHAARAGGLELPAVAAQAPAQALTAVPRLLKSAGPRSLETYLGLLAAELRARKGAGDTACLSVLSFDTPPADTAPGAPLVQWLQQVLAEPAEREAAPALNALEVEVLRKELGADAPERIVVLSGGAQARKWLRSCGATIELLDAMGRLRGPQRRLAVRLMLQSLG